MLFAKSSEDGDSLDQGCFITIVFEKQCRKRTYAKTQTQFAKLTKQRGYRSEKTIHALNVKKQSAMAKTGGGKQYEELSR